MLFLLPAAALAGGACSTDRESCLDSRCCKHSSHGCFKMKRTEYAVCLPYAELGQSKSSCEDGEWECPGWHECDAPYADCSSSRCCGTAAFGCYAKKNTPLAQCRPLPTNGTCVDGESPEWLCPDSWQKCALKDGECTDSHCCRDPKQACFKRPFEQYAQCRPYDEEEEDSVHPWSKCRDTDEWLCPGWEKCDNPDTACTSSQCCNHVGFTCYAVTGHYSHCMRTGSCESQVAANPLWAQQVAAITCEVAGDDAADKWEYVDRRASGSSRQELRQHDYEPPSPPPPPWSRLTDGAAETAARVEEIQLELRRIRADELVRMKQFEERERQMNLVELIVGVLLILTIVTALGGYVAIWTKLSSRNLMMMLQSNTRYSNMEVARTVSGQELPAWPEHTPEALTPTPSPLARVDGKEPQGGASNGVASTMDKIDEPTVTIELK